ncbi:MAG: hypothetical protein GX892_14380 [Thermoanaerobacteraceae bacterium]|nr:hypothetical protein [Thermoanaerobacteraceae bacterium]
MHIKKIVSRHRRDFIANYECEHCGFEVERPGYDDLNFHQNIIPIMECPYCKKRAGEDYRALEPRYPEDMQV